MRKIADKEKQQEQGFVDEWVGEHDSTNYDTDENPPAGKGRPLLMPVKDPETGKWIVDHFTYEDERGKPLHPPKKETFLCDEAKLKELEGKHDVHMIRVNVSPTFDPSNYEDENT